MNQELGTVDKPLTPNSFLLISIILLTGLTVAVRVPGLSVPLFGDEATTFWEHAASSWQTLFSKYNGPNQHSLFSFLSNISIRIFGENEISFRLPSFIAGIFVVPLTWFAGRQILLTSQVSLLAAFLVGFSMPLFEQSQQGRGYTLTVFFALIVFITGKKLFARKGGGLMPLIFIVSGLGLVLTLPSNIYYLAACGVVLLTSFWVENKNGDQFVKLLLKCLPIFLMVGLAAIYLLYIYDDLQRGIATYRIYARDMEGLASLKPSFKKCAEIFLDIAQPWGIPLCLLFIYGFLIIRNPVLLLLFLLPFFFNLALGVQGPPRSYYYWIPFFMLIAAKGIFQLYDRIKSLLPQRMSKVFCMFVALLLILPPVNSIKKFYENRFETRFVKMEEAKKALEFIEEFPENHLFVIPWEDRVLRFYTERKIAGNMLNIVQKGNLGRIIFLGHKSISPEKIAVSGLTSEISFSPGFFKLVERRGDLNIYDFDFFISNIIPLRKDADFIEQLDIFNHSGLQLSTDILHKLIGQESLKIMNTGGQRHLFSKLIRSANFPPGTEYVLYVYARKLDQKSLAGLSAARKKEGMVTNSLNLLFGVFREEDGRLFWEPEHPYRNFRNSIKEGKFYWQIVMLAIPMKEGPNHFREAFQVQNETSYFDGMQAYLMYSRRPKN